MKFGVGAAVPRFEDGRFLRGEGRYGDDVAPAGAAVLELLTAQTPAARIRDADLAAARAAPGVLGVYTIADLDADGVGDAPCLAMRMAPLARPGGAPAFAPGRPALARGAIRHVGEPVVAVVAETRAAALDALELVELDLEDLPFVQTPTAAAAADAPRVWAQAEDNTAYVFEAGDAAAVEAAFAAAAHVATVEIPFTRLAMCPMEARTALGAFEGGRYVLTCGSQNPHILRQTLGDAVFGCGAAGVRVITPDMGGAFGLRSAIFPEIVLALWAARRLGRPVRWTGGRSAHLVGDDQGRDLTMTAALALDEAGRFTGLRVRSLAALGAHLSLFGPIPTFGNIGGVAGVYRTPAIHAEVRAVYTNAPPIAPYRGAGRPEAIACIELAIDRAARDLGLDRFELRRRNMIGPDEMPFRTGLTFTYDSGDFPAGMAMALRLADADGFEARRAEAAMRGRLRGLGFANAIESSAGALDEGVDLRIEPDGGATVLTGSVNHGQGHETMLAQVVAEALGIDGAAVRVAQGDTDAGPRGVGTFGSRTAALAGSAALRAAEAVAARARETAAAVLEVDPRDVALEGGMARIVGTDRAVGWAALAAAAQAAGAPLEASARMAADQGPTFPNGAHVCEVEIDPETGAMAVLRYAVADDVGVAVNPMIVEGQIHGGVAQGLAQVMAERVVFDPDTGQPLTASLMDYALPRAADLPEVAIAHNPRPTRKNPLGAKGAGEAGTVGALPAGLSAILDALAPLGVARFDMPATPERLWRVIEAARAARRG